MNTLEYWIAQLVMAALEKETQACTCYGCLTFHPCDYPSRGQAWELLNSKVTLELQ